MAAKSICKVVACGKPATGRGFCNRHYQRWRRHGDPVAGQHKARAQRGEPLAWLRDHMDFADGRGCLIWPFACYPTGRAKIGYQGRITYAYRVMCELVHGPPPSPDHEAAHSCGKGHEGCIHPGHLRWATSAENSADMVAHGTSTRGTRNAQAKLTERDVRKIRILAGRATQAEIAKRFSVHPMHVHNIVHRKLWAWLD